MRELYKVHCFIILILKIWSLARATCMSPVCVILFYWLYICEWTACNEMSCKYSIDRKQMRVVFLSQMLAIFILTSNFIVLFGIFLFWVNARLSTDTLVGISSFGYCRTHVMEHYHQAAWHISRFACSIDCLFRPHGQKIANSNSVMCIITVKASYLSIETFDCVMIWNANNLYIITLNYLHFIPLFVGFLYAVPS